MCVPIREHLRDVARAMLDWEVHEVDVCRQHGISAATFYQWRSKYGGMNVSDMQRLRELETENGRLKQ